MRAQPSTAMSCVATRKYRTKNDAVRPHTSMCGTLVVAAAASGAPPNTASMRDPRISMIAPVTNWTGTIHDFRRPRPKRRVYSASTTGAHSSFKEYGQLESPNVAWSRKPAPRACKNRGMLLASPMGMPCSV